MGVVSLVLPVILLLRKKCSVYSAIALGLTVFTSLVLLDTAVLIRFLGFLKHGSGHNLGFALNRFFHGSNLAQSEVISNATAFIPFGLLLSEFLASAKQLSTGRRLGLATLAAFGLSLCIECFQLLLRVGFFELTDLVLNTVGAFFGASIAVLLRRFLRFARNERLFGLE